MGTENGGEKVSMVGDMKNPIGVLGAGSWGWALSHMITRKGKGVIIWTRDEEVTKSINKNGANPKRFREFPLKGNFVATSDLREIFERCEIVFVAVSTSAMREVMQKSSKYVEGNHIIISTSKGLELKTGKRMTEIIKEETCCKKIGVLTGPNLAREIIEGNPSGAVIASNIKEVQEKVYEVMHSPFFRIYMSYDVVGAELGGALKNIYAIAAGIAEALGFKLNTLALLLSRAASEMVKFGIKIGAKQETFFGLSGIGDLFVTASSDLSRNKRFGKLIAQGRKPKEAIEEIGEVVEGYPSSKVVYLMSKDMGVKMNIAEAVYKVVHLGKDLNKTIEELLKTEEKQEW